MLTNNAKYQAIVIKLQMMNAQEGGLRVSPGNQQLFMN